MKMFSYKMTKNIAKSQISKTNDKKSEIFSYCVFQ